MGVFRYVEEEFYFEEIKREVMRLNLTGYMNKELLVLKIMVEAGSKGEKQRLAPSIGEQYVRTSL